MFLENKYHRWYDSIVSKGDDAAEYVERHHILPRSLKGSNERSNIIQLTARKHFLAHWLLTKFTTGKARQSMLHAFGAMSTLRERRCLSSWQYELARLAMRDARLGTTHTKEAKQKNREAHLGIEQSEKTRRKRGESLKGHVTREETRKKIGKAHEGRIASQEARENQSISQQKRFQETPMTDETKKRMRESHLGVPKPFLTCPHCGKVGGGGVMYKYHFDECTVAFPEKNHHLSKGALERVTKISRDRSNLTTEDIQNIRKDDRLQREIAKEYGVSRTLISLIQSRKRWADV